MWPRRQRLGWGGHKSRNAGVTRNWKRQGTDSPQILQVEQGSANSLILNFWPPVLWENTFLLFGTTQCVVIFIYGSPTKLVWQPIAMLLISPAGKMIVQTEAKLNKLLDEFVEEKQNNLHRETCVFFQPEPQPNPDLGWAWNIAFFSLPCLLSPTSVSAFALWCCKWLCGWTTLKTNTPMEAAFSSSQGKTPRSWMLWKALAFRDAVGWPGTFIRALNLILSWVRCYITETWKTFWIYVKDFLHSSVSL